MLFEAELRNKKYQIIVDKRSLNWQVSIQEEGKEADVILIPRKDFEEADNVISFLFNGSSYLIDVLANGTDYEVFTQGSYRTVKIFNDEMLLHESLKSGSAQGNNAGLVSGMPGKIVSVAVEEGQSVKKGDPLLVMEAMKMENEMKANGDVTIKSVLVKPGDNVESGATMIVFEVKPNDSKK